MNGDARDPVPIAETLASVRAEFGLPEHDVFGTLLARWQEVVGDDVAAHTRLVTLRHGIATIVADSPLWASQVRYLETAVRERANELVGEGTIVAVKVRVDAS
jgi:predicted nucleic acid-binding Zn ribbon protein